MNVSTSYIFDSPYPDRVQVGRPDPSSTQNTSSQEESQAAQNSVQAAAKDQISTSAKSQDTGSTTSSDSLLDTYA